MTDRDELLRQIGERVVAQTDEHGFLTPLRRSEGTPQCPACGHEYNHGPDCEMTRYLEATDE